MHVPSLVVTVTAVLAFAPAAHAATHMGTIYSCDDGRYAKELFKAAVAARTAGRGLWGHCRKGAVPLRPTRGVSAGPVNALPRGLVAKAGAGCNPNYAPCVPNSASDLDCPQVGHPVKVVGSDPYNLDSDGDGHGCESS